MWQKQLSILPDRTYAPNLYPYGDDIGQWAEQCLRRIPAQRLVIVGCSVGGSCALEILHRAPRRVAAAILIGTKARHDPDPACAANARRIIETQGVAAAWKQLWQPLFPPQEPDLQAAAQAIALDQSPKDLIQGLTAFHSRTSREDIVKNSNCAIHFVSGDQDTLPGLAYSRRLAELTPKARLHVIKDCGHYVPMMRPGETNALIESVLGQVAVA